MPRIRYRRDYDWTPDFSESESEPEESGNSWLSNKVIAAQLSEARIKTAIKALKAQITVLENELLSRRLGHRDQTYKNWNNIGNARPKENGRRYSKASSNRRDRSFNGYQKIRKTLKKLGIKDVDALIKEWSKIQQGKSE